MFMEGSVTQVEIAVELLGCFCESRRVGFLIHAHHTITVQDARGWFEHCGYFPLEARKGDK